MRELTRLRELPRTDRRLLAACCIAAPIVAAGIRWNGFLRLQNALAKLSDRFRREAPMEASAREEARRVVRVVAIAAERGPIRVTCLGRALLAWWILRQRGITTTIRVGVRR